MPVDLKRALKDKKYLDSLSREELKECLQLVAGSQTLDDAELDLIAGGQRKGGAGDAVGGSQLLKPSKRTNWRGARGGA